MFVCALCHASDFPRSKKKRALCEVCFDGLAPRGLAWCTGRGMRAGHRVKIEDIAGGGRAWCKACNRRYQQQPHVAAPHAERAKRWRQEHAEYVKAYTASRPTRPSDPARRRRLYLKNRQQEIERAKAWRQAHHEQALMQWKRARIRKALRALYGIPAPKAGASLEQPKAR